MISGADNRKINRKRPSEYRLLIEANEEQIEEILKGAICPGSLFADDYDLFLKERANLLYARAREHLDKG